jgi:hypothetical protein
VPAAQAAGVDEYHLRIEHPGLDRAAHRRLQSGGGQAAMCEQDLDQRSGARGVATLPTGGVPVPLMGLGERAAGLGLGQRGRAR